VLLMLLLQVLLMLLLQVVLLLLRHQTGKSKSCHEGVVTRAMSVRVVDDRFRTR